MIKNIIFDMGNVLIEFNPEHLMDRYDLTEEDREILRRNVYRSLEWAAQDSGRLTEEDTVPIFCKRVPEHLSRIAYELTCEWYRELDPVEGMHELVKELKSRGYHLYLLSNASVHQHDYWPSVPGSELFEGTVVSADVKLVKPQPEIFRYTLDKFGLKAEESVFIDDNTPNCETAYQLGIHPIVFHGDSEELREKLRELDVPV